MQCCVQFLQILPSISVGFAERTWVAFSTILGNMNGTFHPVYTFYAVRRREMRHMEGKRKPNAIEAHNLFVEFGYNGLFTATCTLDVMKVFPDLNPTKSKLRVPFEFVPPAVPAGHAQAAKPKPKPKAQLKHEARQLSMASLFSKNATKFSTQPRNTRNACPYSALVNVV